MKILALIFATIIALSMMITINANQRKRHSNDLFEDRLINLLLEAKQREFFFNKEIERRRSESFDEDNYERTHIRRKAVGLGDDPI